MKTTKTAMCSSNMPSLTSSGFLLLLLLHLSVGGGLEMVEGAALAPMAGQEPSASATIVRTENGLLEGFPIALDPPPLLSTVRFRHADIFLGIPFARPPIRELRLKKPTDGPANWEGVLDASRVPPACVPVHRLAALGEESEDCLYLNVFRPSSVAAGAEKTDGVETNSSDKRRRSRSQSPPPPSAVAAPSTQTEDSPKSSGGDEDLWPVLVFVHGGGFSLGGSFVEGYHNLSNHFAAQGIVVVTVQYRLGFFGFLSDGSAELPGNLGLWDQRQALVWVQRNIRAFGGDPARVTLWGQSAGAASVSMLSRSPHSRGLFHRAIQQSGSRHCPWALNEGVVDVSRELIQRLGCSTPTSGQQQEEHATKSAATGVSSSSSSEEEQEGPREEKKKKKGKRQGWTSVGDCLRRLRLEAITDALAETSVARASLHFVAFNPRPGDTDFFGDLLIHNKNDTVAAFSEPLPSSQPLLVSFTSHESLFADWRYPDAIFTYDSPLVVPDNLGQFTLSSFEQAIRGLVRAKKTPSAAEDHQEANEEEEDSVNNRRSNGGGFLNASGEDSGEGGAANSTARVKRLELQQRQAAEERIVGEADNSEGNGNGREDGEQSSQESAISSSGGGQPSTQTASTTENSSSSSPQQLVQSSTSPTATSSTSQHPKRGSALSATATTQKPSTVGGETSEGGEAVAEAVAAELIAFYANQSLPELNEDLALSMVQQQQQHHNSGYSTGAERRLTTGRWLLERYTLLLSDLQFIVPALVEAGERAHMGSSVTLLQFDHVSQSVRPHLPFRGVVHAGDYPFTVGTHLFGSFPMDNGEDRRVRDELVGLFGGFIRGMPDPLAQTVHDRNNRTTNSSIATGPTIPTLPTSPINALRVGGPNSAAADEGQQQHLKTDGLSRSVRLRLAFWRDLARRHELAALEAFPGGSSRQLLDAFGDHAPAVPVMRL